MTSPEAQVRQRPDSPDTARRSASGLLAARLRDLAARATAPEELFELALQAFIDASPASAGALCLFDQRHDLLRLATDVGLSDEGCRQLRSVRRGGAGWDMPLHGLLNRRVYLIDSASRNRYVPPLVEPAASVRTVVCLPLYVGSTPIGSLVLVAVAPHTFNEQDIGQLAEPLRDLAKQIEAAKKRLAAAPSATSPPSAVIARPAPAASIAPPSQAAPVAGGSALAESERERARLAAALEAAAAELAEQRRVQATIEATRASLHAAELVRLTTRLSEAEGALTCERTQWESERQRLEAELCDASAREDLLRQQLEAATERAETAGREELRLALEAARAAEEAHAAAMTEAEGARAECASLERLLQETRKHAEQAGARLGELESRIEALASERDHLQQSLAAAEATHNRLLAEQADAAERTRVGDENIKRLEAELRDASAREDLLRQQLEAATDRAETAGQQELRLALEAARAAEEAHAAAMAEAEGARAECARLEGVVEALEEKAGARLGELESRIEALRTEHAAEVGGLVHQVEALATERDHLRQSLAAAEATQHRLLAEQADAAERASVSERARLERELEEARIAEQQASARLAQLEGELATLRTERDAEAAALTARLETLAAERDALQDALAAVTVETAAVSGTQPASEPRPPAEPMREVRAPREAMTIVEGDPGQKRLVVIDTDPAWERIALDGSQVTLVPPGPDIAERLAAVGSARVVANLAGRGTLEALAALRAAGSIVPFWGCLAEPGADRGIALGMIEPAARPLDPDAVLAALSHLARGARVVTVGNDVDALMSLRQAMGRQGMSVSMAWDDKQATDLLAMVRPDVVVIDLEQPPRVGYGLVVRLASTEPIPRLVLIGGAAGGFAAELASPANLHRGTGLGRLLAMLVDRTVAPASAQPGR